MYQNPIYTLFPDEAKSADFCQKKMLMPADVSRDLYIFWVLLR